MPTGSGAWDGRIQPAQLAFLAIYNPDLGPTDETFRDQIVFYHSRAAQQNRKSKSRKTDDDAGLHEQENEKLRQIGLAQGMVNFVRGFSHNEPVDSIETEKSRIVLHELEKGWWVLASIDLTRIPVNPTSQPPAGTTEHTNTESAIEYSSREVAPPSLLIQDLTRAYSIFVLHHGPSLSFLYVRLSRPKFCNTLNRFWTQFAQEWDVLLHGNPAVDALGGLKLAAGGELGFGVGEEEWGSGEREVLEDLVGRTDGLVDIVVSRFGEPLPSKDADSPTSKKHGTPPSTWIGYGHDPQAPDGMIFGGLGNLTRTSLRNLSHWMAMIYSAGDHAYGVGQNPHSDRRRQKRNRDHAANGNFKQTRKRNSQTSAQANNVAEVSNSPTAVAADTQQATRPGIPPPIVSAAESALNNAILSADAHQKADAQKDETGTIRKRPALLSSSSWMRVLTLGYMGSPTSAKTEQSDETPGTAETVDIREQHQAPLTRLEPTPDGASEEHERLIQEQQESSGYYLIGLKGDLAIHEGGSDYEDHANESGNRLLLRTLYVKLAKKTSNVLEIPQTLSRNASYDGSTGGSASTEGNAEDDFKRLRVVVYVHRPFIYSFLFEPSTDSLSIPSFYRSLAAHLKPLHKPLCSNTSPSKINSRIESAQHSVARTTSASTSTSNQRIYDLIYDPINLTVHTSLPNIPDPSFFGTGDIASLDALDTWSRVEALNVHTQILNTLVATQHRPHEIERTCKTSRGWWVVWMRLPPSPSTPQAQTDELEEQRTITQESKGRNYRHAFLVRKASDWQSSGSARASGANAISGGMFSLRSPNWGGGANASSGWGPARLAEGIGIDARKYVEGLLSLNR